MRCSGFAVFILWLFLHGDSSLANTEPETLMSQEVTIAEQCNGYCFSIVKPSMDHFNQLREEVESYNKMKHKIYLLVMHFNTILDQIKLKDELIKDKVKQIKSLKEQNKLKSDSSNFQKELFEAKIKSLEAEIVLNLGKLNATIDENEVKGSRIKELEKNINELNTKTEDNKALTDRLNVFETEANNSRVELIAKTKEIAESQAKIKDQETEIKHCQDQLTIKEGLVKTFESTIREKELQLKSLTCEANCCLPFVNSTDIHSIRLPELDPFDVPCNSSVSGSGWTVIQRRVNGNVVFNRTWTDYKHGFGDLRENFFLGLEKIHQMTQNQPHELYIQLGGVNGDTAYAHYDDFKVGSEGAGYKLKSLGTYSGTAGDSITKEHLNMKFSTFDRDHDKYPSGNCAELMGGGWWFNACGDSMLNGEYGEEFSNLLKTWSVDGLYVHVSFSQMMIRPKPLQNV